jgi:hypothetical protein
MARLKVSVADNQDAFIGRMHIHQLCLQKLIPQLYHFILLIFLVTPHLQQLLIDFSNIGLFFC